MDSRWNCEFAIFANRVKAKTHYRFAPKLRILYRRKLHERQHTLYIRVGSTNSIYSQTAWKPTYNIHLRWKCELAIFAHRLKAKIHYRFALKVRTRDLRKPLESQKYTRFALKVRIHIFANRLKANMHYIFAPKVWIRHFPNRSKA